jgi:hypothetical protein
MNVAEYATSSVAAVRYDVKKTRRQDQDLGVVAWPVTINSLLLREVSFLSGEALCSFPSSLLALSTSQREQRLTCFVSQIAQSDQSKAKKINLSLGLSN